MPKKIAIAQKTTVYVESTNEGFGRNRRVTTTSERTEESTIEIGQDLDNPSRFPSVPWDSRRAMDVFHVLLRWALFWREPPVQ